MLAAMVSAICSCSLPIAALAMFAYLLTLVEADGAEADDPRRPGLFHVAIHLPSAQALSDWLAFALRAEVPLTGASDHGASRAIYLDDPEGNGIEVYRDRPRAEWARDGDGYVIATHRLDLDALAADAAEAWTGAPEGTTVGHVHLQVGDLDEAAAFYDRVLGMERMAVYPGASFWSTGRYHHHLGANVWNSRGASRRDGTSAGLAEVVLRADDPTRARLGTDRIVDPWGIPFALVA